MREGVKMRRCEDEKMRYRPPLLEEPCAQTLSGKIMSFLIGFSRCANRENQSQGLLQGPASALLICIKIDDLQGL